MLSRKNRHGWGRPHQLAGGGGYEKQGLGGMVFEYRPEI